MATKLAPRSKPRDWNHASAEARIADCLKTLYLHGFTTEAENQRIKKRIQAWTDALLAEKPSS